MKLIVGFFTCRPGLRDAFLAAAQDHARQSRLEPECLYFELVPMPEHPDKVLLAEAFTSEAAHREHEDTDHMRDLWAVMPQLLLRAEIDNLIDADFTHDDEWFEPAQAIGSAAIP